MARITKGESYDVDLNDGESFNVNQTAGSFSYSDGVASAPKFSSGQTSVTLELSSNLSLPGGSWDNMDPVTVVDDNLGGSLSGFEYLVPDDGTYLLVGHGFSNDITAGEHLGVRVAVNGTAVTRAFATSSNALISTAETTRVEPLLANDAVKLQINSSVAGTAISGSTDTYLSIIRLG